MTAAEQIPCGEVTDPLPGPIEMYDEPSHEARRIRAIWERALENRNSVAEELSLADVLSMMHIAATESMTVALEGLRADMRNRAALLMGVPR